MLYQTIELCKIVVFNIVCATWQALNLVHLSTSTLIFGIQPFFHLFSNNLICSWLTRNSIADLKFCSKGFHFFHLFFSLKWAFFNNTSTTLLDSFNLFEELEMELKLELEDEGFNSSIFPLFWSLQFIFSTFACGLGGELYIPSFELVFSYPSFANVITLVRAGFNLSLVAANFVALITLIYSIVQHF